MGVLYLLTILFKSYSYQHNDYVTDLTWHPTNHSEYLTCSWDGYLKSHEFSLKQLNGH
jgi:hypothetical protein